jgi:periplasmic protein TonB
LDSSIAESKPKVDKPRKNWLFIAACVALVVASVAAGVFYFWGQPAHNYVPRATSSATPQSAPETMAQAAPLSAANLPNPAPVRTGQPANPSSASTITANPNPPKGSTISPAAGSTPAAPKKQAAANVTAGMVTDALNAHPVTALRAEAVPYDAAPSLEPDPSSTPQSDGLPAIVASSNDAPPPPLPTPEGPVRVGGQVKEPRLISSAKPIYPALAQKTAVQGDVVIETTIDKNGSVAKMHVVSGPSLLRQAALNAVRQWRYEPLLLNNQPISVEMMVTVKFRL